MEYRPIGVFELYQISDETLQADVFDEPGESLNELEEELTDVEVDFVGKRKDEGLALQETLDCLLSEVLFDFENDFLLPLFLFQFFQ